MGKFDYWSGPGLSQSLVAACVQSKQLPRFALLSANILHSFASVLKHGFFPSKFECIHIPEPLQMLYMYLSKHYTLNQCYPNPCPAMPKYIRG